MKPAIKMIAIDLDGTLLDSRKRISDDDMGALQAAHNQGIDILPVTGRNYSFARPVIELLPFDVPLVTTNGAVIRSLSGETFLRRLLPLASASHILEATAEFRSHTVVVYDQAGPGHLRIQTGFQGASHEATTVSGGVATSAWLKRNESFVQRFTSLDEALDGDPLEILFTGPLHVVAEVSRRLTNDVQVGQALSLSSTIQVSEPRPIGNGSLELRETSGIDTHTSNGFRLLRTEYADRDFAILDAINSECSKGHALEYWSRARGIAPAEIMAIGDNYNDLEMLRFAGFPVVMGNADETLKSQGWPITLDCDSSGVAHAIRQYVL